MQKDYTIKVYTLANVFERVLSPAIVMSGVSFSETINGGQWQLTVRLKLPFTTTDIGYNNIIRVYETDTNNAPRLIYSGLVWNITRVLDNSGESIEVRCVGLASLLSLFYFYQSSSYTFTKSQAGDLTIENVIDYFSTKYPGLISYTAGSLDTATSVSLDFDYTKCLDALKQVSDAFSTWYWYIWPDGLFTFKSKSTIGTHHKVQVGRSIEQITVEENAERICNKRMVKYTGGVATVSDATSISNNGIRELFVDYSTRYGSSLTSATTDATNFIAQNKDEKRKIKIELNSEYDIESIRAGDFITVQNFDYEISSLQVVKLQYNTDRIMLELEEYESFTNELLI